MLKKKHCGSWDKYIKMSGKNRGRVCIADVMILQLIAIC